MQSICAAALAATGIDICKSDVFSLQVNESVEKNFMSHISKHGLSYGTQEEYQFRLEQFALADVQINQINSKNGASYAAEHNQFSTWTDAEFDRLLGEKNMPEYKVDESKIKPIDLSVQDIPESIDWRPLGAVNPVKNQGKCGSCWSFSATSAIESAHFIASGILLNLAEQQIVDCDTVDEGCNGGYAWDAFNYVKDHPQMLQADYPYTAVDGKCEAKDSEGKVLVTEWFNTTPLSANELKAAIVERPISVSVHVGDSWRYYKSGTFNDLDCPYDPNHAVMAVGFGVDEQGQDYYLVRNSWGTGWGEEGYIKVAVVPGEGICGITHRGGFYPITN